MSAANSHLIFHHLFQLLNEHHVKRDPTKPCTHWSQGKKLEKNKVLRLCITNDKGAAFLKGIMFYSVKIPFKKRCTHELNAA